MDPQQFQESVAKKEAAIGGALAGMRIRRPFGQPKLDQPIRCRRSNRGADEKVIEFGCHPATLCVLPAEPYASSSPRMVPVAEANLSVSRPMRCSIETKRFGSG